MQRFASNQHICKGTDCHLVTVLHWERLSQRTEMRDSPYWLDDISSHVEEEHVPEELQETPRNCGQPLGNKDGL